MFNPLGLSLNNTMTILLGSSPTGTRTIALNTTFESFILLESVSHEVKWFLWWKCLDCLDWNGLFWCSECGHSRQMYNILSIGRASMFVMPCLVFYNVWWQGRISYSWFWWMEESCWGPNCMENENFFCLEWCWL